MIMTSLPGMIKPHNVLCLLMFYIYWGLKIMRMRDKVCVKKGFLLKNVASLEWLI